MYKRILALSFVFMLVLSPFSVMAAEVEESNASEEDESTELENEVDSENAVDEGDSSEEAKAEDTDTSAKVADDNTDADEEEVQADEEISTYATDDEDLDFSNIYGTAKTINGIEYNLAKGYYILDLRAGFGTHQVDADHDIEDKWIAFALPNGIEVADELPSGVAPISIDGKNGLAVKVPNVKGSTTREYIEKDIPLRGTVDDNDPYQNLHMVNVDPEEGTYEDIGEVRSQRDIDFSVMEENPSIDLTGSITGDTKFDSSQGKVYYLLDVTAEVENDAYEDVEEDLYVGFDLPEGVAVLNNDDTPQDIEMLNLGDGQEVVGLKLPALNKDKESQEVSYTIPVIGMSDEVVQSDTIDLYTFPSANIYNNVGQFPGHISVDFSNMDEEWYFDIKNEVITDYPGVNDNQKGFRFNYITKNLTLDDVDEVSMEFTVPNGITIEKPQYIGGSKVDIDWDGNVATVTLGDLDEFNSGYHGYFTAVGTTSKSIAELKDTEVTVTLNRDGETEVTTLSSPFVEGKYDEADFDTPETPEDPETPEEPETPEDPEKENGTDNDDVTVDVEDGGDPAVDSETTTPGDNELPKTATNTFTMMLIGSMLILAGGTFFGIRKLTLNK